MNGSPLGVFRMRLLKASMHFPDRQVGRRSTSQISMTVAHFREFKCLVRDDDDDDSFRKSDEFLFNKIIFTFFLR